MIRQLFFRAGRYFTGLTFSKILTTLVIVLYARVLGPSQFGEFAFLITILFLSSALAEMGLNLYYQKAVHTSHSSHILNDILSAQALATIIVWIFTSIFFYSTGVFQIFDLGIWFIGFIPHSMSDAFRGYYLSQGKTVRVSHKTAITSYVLLAGLALIHPMNLQTAKILLAIGSLMGSVFMTPWKEAIKFRFAGFTQALRTIHKSIPYSFLTIISFAYARGDQMIIRYTLSLSELGFYGLAYRFLDAVSLAPTALTQTLFSYSAKEAGISSRVLLKILLGCACAGLLAGFGLWLFADPLVRYLLGEAYLQTVVPLKIFGGVAFLFFVNAPLSTVIQSSHLLKKFLPFAVFNTLFNLIANFVLTPIFGIQGAAYCMLLTEVTGLILNFYFITKLYGKRAS